MSEEVGGAFSTIVAGVNKKTVSLHFIEDTVENARELFEALSKRLESGKTFKIEIPAREDVTKVAVNDIK